MASPPEDVKADEAPCGAAGIATPGPDEPAAGENSKKEPDLTSIVLRDASGILAAPLRWSGKDWLLFSGAVAGVAALGAAADVPIRNFSQDHKSSAADRFAQVIEPLGQEYSWAVVSAYGVAGFLFHDTASKEIAIDSSMAILLANGVVTPALKRVVGRARPYQDEGADSFHPFESGFNSFPSGHTTQAFAVASVISAHSDKLWVNISAYTLATMVGFARIYHDAHWASDVSAGALIGTAVGHGVVAINTKLRSSARTVRIAAAPWIVTGNGHRGTGVTVVLQN